MTKQTKVIIAIIIIAVLGVAGFVIYKNNAASNNLQGHSKTKQPAGRENIPQDKETCEAQKGEWGRFGLVAREQCNLPTSDADKTCSNQNECEGACIVELSKEDQDRLTKQNEVIEANGKCTSWLLTYGCDAYVKDGKVDGILCID
ncbi:MAG: hypothetical protein NTV77_01260 [Candidatus Azambacteria bacterium]|nr:hypothetical protein [Candidatus Azambacteria bacterium]